MEQLFAFIATPAGKIVCMLLIAVGITDILIAWIFLGKVVKQNEQAMVQGMPHQEAKAVQDRIKRLKKIIKLITIAGSAFAVFGVFGLTR